MNICLYDFWSREAGLEKPSMQTACPLFPGPRTVAYEGALGHAPLTKKIRNKKKYENMCVSTSNQRKFPPPLGIPEFAIDRGTEEL